MLITASIPAMQRTHECVLLYPPKFLAEDCLFPTIIKNDVKELLSIKPDIELTLTDTL